MAGNVDYNKIIEDHAIQVINDNTDYNTDHFYGTFNPQELLHFVKGRLNTVKGTIFVRVSEANYTQMDTLGEAYHVDFTLQMLVGQKPTRSKQLPDRDRETDAIKKEVRGLMIQNPVTIDGDKYRIFLDREDSLIYTTDLDAQLIEFQIGNVYTEIT